MKSPVPFSGLCQPEFRHVEEVFRASFERDDTFCNVGAGVAVYVGGKCMVNLAGGQLSEAASAPWQTSTLVNVWSTTKGLMAIAFARLVERGLVAYEDRVARYWPEFATAGKADIRVIDVLSHQSGMNGFAEPTTIEEFADWDLLIGRLGRQAPFWPPRSHTSYHAMTYGFLAGEIARRVTGLTLRELFRRELAAPAAAEVYLGLPPSERSRLADIIPPATWTTTASSAVNPIARPATENPAPRPDWANREDWRGGQVPAANGHATADGLARVYGALANKGEIDGVQLLSTFAIAQLTALQSQRDDSMLGARRWAAGVVLNDGASFGPNPEAFGHAGWGGSFGCADPKAGVAIGYTLNRMGAVVVGDPRGRAISQAVFECAGRLGA